MPQADEVGDSSSSNINLIHTRAICLQARSRTADIDWIVC